MSRIRVLICRVDDGEQMTELAAYDLGGNQSVRLEEGQLLDELEAATHRTGHAILREVLRAQWALLDERLTAAYMAQMAPLRVQRDGQEPLKVASRFGVVELIRQRCRLPGSQTQTMPGNAVLPAHAGMVITRGLQEWACLLCQDVSFATAARLLGWQTQDAAVLSDTTLRRLVRKHGHLIREAERVETLALTQQPEAGKTLQVVPHPPARQRPAWPAELNAAVEQALAAHQVRPPDGVSWADWSRVLAVRQTEASRPVAVLRQLGPQLAPHEVLVTVDEVLTRQPAPHHFWELRTARLTTQQGYRYVSGSGPAFLQQLLAMLLLALGTQSSLLLIADGARWIRDFFTQFLAVVADKQMILDWYHLRQKCREFCRRIAATPDAQADLLRRLSRRLWQGKLDRALRLLVAYRSQALDTHALDRFIAYLLARQPFLANDRQRRIDQRFIGSGHVEKANDLLAAKRQKVGGMQWSLSTSDALASLRTLFLNQGWDRYWERGQVLPLAV